MENLKRTVPILLLAILLLSEFFSVFGAEIDSFSKSPENLEDTTWLIEELINNRIENALQSANSSDTTCDQPNGEKNLYKQLINELIGKTGFLTYTNVERALIDNPGIPQNHFPVKESVYRDFTFLESPVLNTVPLGSLFKIGELLIGSDKIGHFFATGYQYFEIAVLQKKGEAAAIKFGINTETNIFGRKTTGIYSYGDLAANFRGMHFWQNLLSGEKQHLTCENKKWEYVHKFSFEAYFDPSFDESINCSTYRNKTMEKKVDARIALEISSDGPKSCPMNLDKCSEIVEKYKNLKHFKTLVSPRCR